MMDPPNVFKDAVDGLLQGAMMAMNGSTDIPWHCLALIWHPIRRWQLPTQVHALYPQKMMYPSNVFKDAVDGLFQGAWRHWMVQITYLDIVLPWYDIPITVDNSQNGRKLSTPDWSFKCLHDAVDEQFQGCGREIPRQIFCLHLIGTLHATTDHGELVPEGGRLAFFTRWAKRCEGRFGDSGGKAQRGGGGGHE